MSCGLSLLQPRSRCRSREKDAKHNHDDQPSRENTRHEIPPVNGCNQKCESISLVPAATRLGSLTRTFNCTPVQSQDQQVKWISLYNTPRLRQRTKPMSKRWYNYFVTIDDSEGGK